MGLAQRYLFVAMLLASLFSGSAGAQSYAVTYRNWLHLDHGEALGFKAAELSGITYLGAETNGVHRFAAVEDNRTGRVVFIDAQFNADGSLITAQITGGIVVAHRLDFEGIAAGRPAMHSVWLSAENSPADSKRSSLWEFSLKDGRVIQSAPIIAVFGQQRHNRGFESLTIRPDGKEMWVANEEALTVDGPHSTATHGSVVRLQQYRLVDNRPLPDEQFFYTTDPIFATPVGDTNNYSRSGLADLVALNDGTLLALERSFAFPWGYETRIYQIERLANQQTAKYELFRQKGTAYGNLEGLALGPKLPSGHHVLLGVVDDGDTLSPNAVVAFELSKTEIE